MPRPGMCWRHVILGTLNSWLPGDERGFRNRKHRIHSIGDYKTPPPAVEHIGLRIFNEKASGEPIILPKQLRKTVGEAILEHLQGGEFQVLAVAIAGMHAHILVELPDDKKAIK
jgi:hypothetical protein